MINLTPWRKKNPSPGRLPLGLKPICHLPTTLFVGREADVIRLTDLLQDPAHRLIVLIGLAGIGKTRLALQVAHSQLDRFPHGVFFVSLAPLTSPEMIVTSIGAAIGFQFHEASEPQKQLLRYLREKQMLIVLDNLEHLMAGASLLSAVLQAAPGIKFLVTSRERLNLQGEWVFEVKGLPYPSSWNESSVEQYEAVQLFLQNALQVHPAFRLNKENQEWVVRICQLTEGMPLGIELAAAWVRVLSCQQIPREIERNLDFLKDLRPRPPRAAPQPAGGAGPLLEPALSRRKEGLPTAFRVPRWISPGGGAGSGGGQPGRVNLTPGQVAVEAGWRGAL